MQIAHKQTYMFGLFIVCLNFLSNKSKNSPKIHNSHTLLSSNKYKIPPKIHPVLKSGRKEGYTFVP